VEKDRKMNVRIRLWSTIAILVGAIMVISGLLALAWNSQLILLTNSLRVSAFTQNNDSYAAYVFDHNATVVDVGVLASNL
jgi:hypothetical protein